MSDIETGGKIGRKSVALILGGGRGSRLFPLTVSRSKPAVSIGGKYRLIDIPISNCINSGISMIYVLTQFLSASLNRHITRTYRFDAFSSRFVEILASEQTPTNFDYAQGTADAVRRSVRYLEYLDADYVFILSGDQLCRIDLNHMMSHHLKKGADVSLSCIRIPEPDVRKSGVVRVDSGNRITDFSEKPTEPAIVERYRISGRPDGRDFLGSMGIYLFNKQVLLEVLKNIEEHDFGKGIFPKMIGTHRVFAYPFDGYWEDIGTIKSYFDASMQLLEENPPFSFYDFEMPIYTHQRFLPSPKIFGSMIDQSMISEGCIIKDARIQKSIVGLRSYIRPGCDIQESIVMGNDYFPSTFGRMTPDEKDRMDFSVKGKVTIRRAIVDKNVVIGENSIIRGSTRDDITVHKGEDAPYHIINGIVVIPRNTVLPPGTVIDAESSSREPAAALP